MDLQTRKIEFIQEFLKLQNEAAIKRFENLLRKEKGLEPMSAERLNNRIDKSEKDFKNNRFKSSSELLAKYGA